MRAKWISLLLCTMVMLTACKEVEVVSQLSQYEANEILVLLHSNGIAAEITKATVQSVTSFGVTVSADDLDRSRSILSKEKMLRPKESGMKDIFAETGFIPTPQEQKAKVLVSLKGEIINALVHKIPDVIDADVLLNIPAAEEFGSEAVPEPPSASVIVKVRPTEQAMATVTEAKLQRFVANAVERLDPRNVTVIITYTEAPATMGARAERSIISAGNKAPASTEASTSEVPSEGYVTIAGLNVREASMPRLKIYLAVFLGVIALLALGLIMTVVRGGRAEEEPLQALPEAEGFPQLESGEE